MRTDARIAGRHHGPVRGRLVLEDACLGALVGILGDVSIEVVRREIEPDGDVRVIPLDGLELEAAGLDHVPRRRRGRLDLRRERHTDVAAHEHRLPGRLDHPAHQRRRRRLALGTGDRDDRPGHERGRELQFADDAYSAGTCGLQGTDVGRYAWTHDDQAGVDGHVVRHRTETELDAERLQLVAFGQIRLGVDQRHAAALLQDESAGCKAAAAPAHHRHMAPRDVVRDRRHRSLRVVRLNSAQTIAMIRKRVMTFGSLQPMSSKW